MTTKLTEKQKKMGMGIGAEYVAEIPLEESSLLSYPETHIAMITHNRPHVRNAILIPELKYWQQLFRQANANRDVKAIILNANGPDFASGDNLRQAPVENIGQRPDRRLGLVERLQQYYTMDGPGPATSNKITIASVHGWCCGTAGLDLVLDSDLCIACECAQFGAMESRLGMGGIVKPQMIFHIGLKRTRELYLHGGALSAKKAMEWGLINEVVPHDDEHKKLRERTMEWAKMVCLYPQDGLMTGRVTWVNILRILGIHAADYYKTLGTVLFTGLLWRKDESNLNFLKLRKDHGVTEAVKMRDEAWEKLGFYRTGVGEGPVYTAADDKKARKRMPAWTAKKRD